MAQKSSFDPPYDWDDDDLADVEDAPMESITTKNAMYDDTFATKTYDEYDGQVSHAGDNKAKLENSTSFESRKSMYGYDEATDMITANSGYPFFQLLAAIVAVVSAGVECFEDKSIEDSCTGNGEAFAFYFMMFLLVCILIYLRMIVGDPSTTKVVGFSVFLFMAWAIYAAFTTFEAPFVEVGNGFFGAWGGVVSATGMLITNANYLEKVSDKVGAIGIPLCLLVFASVLVLFDSISAFDEVENDGVDFNEGDVLTGVIVSSISLLFTTGRIASVHIISDRQAVIFGYFMILLWLIGSLVLTFGIFRVVGNGFCGCWAAFFVSLWMTRNSKLHAA